MMKMNTMKKQIAAFMAVCLLMTATSCAEASEETQMETTMTSVVQAEESSDESDVQDQDPSDIDSQLDMIAGCHDYINTDFCSNFDFDPGISFAVTDLNHNGRLEIIVSVVQGSGVYSHTAFYEISEDHSSLERLSVNGEAYIDEVGDFLRSVAIYDCYLKDGEYYYLVQDYVSGGWNCKADMFYSYSFGNGVTSDRLGGYEISAENVDGLTTVNIWLHGPSGVLFDSNEAYLDHMNAYWSDYERQDSCEIHWMLFSGDMDFAEAIAESYNAFDPHSGSESPITYDYHEFCDSLYGGNGTTEFEYVIN